MSQTSSTPGHVQSRDARQHQAPLEEIQRLTEALKETQDEIEFLKEELEKERAGKCTLWIENRRLRGPGHGTSGDQTSIQQWQDRAEEAERRGEAAERRAEAAERRAEKAERRAEKAEGKLRKILDVELPDLMHSMIRNGNRIFANKMREIFDDEGRPRLKNQSKIPSHSKQPPPHQSGSDTKTSCPKMDLVERVQRRSTTEKDTSAGSKETAALHSIRSKGDSTGPKQEAQDPLQIWNSMRPNTLPRVPLLPLSMLSASPKGPASRALDRPSSQQQSSSRQVRPTNLSNTDCQSRFPHETTSAVKECVLTLGKPFNLLEDYIPGWDPDPSPLPEIPAASTASAISEVPQPETTSIRGYWPGAEPAEVQSAVRDHDIHSLSAGTTGDSTQDEEQTPDTISTPVAARKSSKGIPAATSRTRGKYWPRGRIE